MSGNFTLEILPCKKGSILPALTRNLRTVFTGHMAPERCGLFSPDLASASQIVDINTGKACFTVRFKCWLLSGHGNEEAILAPFLMAEQDFPVKKVLDVEIANGVMTGAIITLSDKGAEGLRQDRAGPALQELLEGKFPGMRIDRYILPDEKEALRALLTDLALRQHVKLVVTTGGTGVSPRDITPQVTLSVMDYELPGFAWLMMRESAAKTPHAAISRAVCGVLGKCLVINVPGSVRGSIENLQAVLPALPHALSKLNGNMEDCGG